MKSVDKRKAGWAFKRTQQELEARAKADPHSDDEKRAQHKAKQREPHKPKQG